MIAQIAAGGEADVDRAVRAARAAFNRGDWSRMAPADRKSVLLRFADLIEAHGEELALVEAIDAGKPITDCRGLDLPDVLGTIRWYAETADKVFGKTSPTDADHLGLIVREPVGVVGGVLPWNFPMAMLAWKIGPALATGNSVVIKPPELASLTTLRMAELALEAGVPRGVFNVVPGLGHVAGRALGLHPDVDMITFTGSTEVGREFLRYSADSNLKGTVLEMGGKSPQIVMADCRDILDAVAADLAGAAFWAAGQNCSAGSRILVHSSIKDDFVSALAEQAERRTVGDPVDERTVIGPLIEADALDRVLGYVEQARADGATVVTGGAPAARGDRRLVHGRHRAQRRRPRDERRAGRDLRPGRVRAELRRRVRSPVPGQRHHLRAGGHRVVTRYRRRAPHRPRDPGGHRGRQRL